MGMFAVRETADSINLFKNEKEIDRFEFKDTTHARKIFDVMIEGKLPNEIVDFIVDNKVKELIVDKSLLKANVGDFKSISFVDNHKRIRYLKEKIKSDYNSTRGLSHIIAHSNVNFYTLDPLIVHSYAIYKQIELDMEKYDKRALEIYLNYLPELKIKKNKSEDDSDKVFYKEQYNIEVIQKLWKIKEHANVEQNLAWTKNSVGIDASEEDWKNLERIVSLFNLKNREFIVLKKYLQDKLVEHAPNLTALLGYKLSAEIISLAGTLVNLSKFPAGTIQILGAEKALFRSL